MATAETPDTVNPSAEDITLRDLLASRVDVPYDKVVEMISLMRARDIQAEKEAEGETLSFTQMLEHLTENKANSNITIKQIVELRAFLRYLEADEMLKVRQGTIAGWLKDSGELTEDRWEAVANDE